MATATPAKMKLARKVSYTPSYVHPLGGSAVPSYVHPLAAKPAVPAVTAPGSTLPTGSSAPIVPPDPANDPKPPDPRDSQYQGEIAGNINTRGFLISQLAQKYTQDTAGATTAGNKAGLLHSSTLANQLADIDQTRNIGQQGIYAQYGDPSKEGDYGTAGATAYGAAAQRHINDPTPFARGNDYLAEQSGGATGLAGSPVKLASGWRILYDASGKAVRFLKPGETWNGQ